MNGDGNVHQDSCDQKKENPCDQQPDAGERQPAERRDTSALCHRFCGDLPQARRTDDAIIVLGNALATEELCAFRTARHGFARGMMQATLGEKDGHDQAAVGSAGRRRCPSRTIKPMSPIAVPMAALIVAVIANPGSPTISSPVIIGLPGFRMA
jgi:hypothetical protein